jgi:hypothetical protein
MENKLLYSLSGRIDDTVHDWEFIPSENPSEMAYNEAEGYYPDKGGKLFGPAVEGIKAFSYYELAFTASAQEDCYWGVMFYDQNNEEIVADVYSSIYAGDNLKYKQVVYGREKSISLHPFFQSVNGVEICDLKIQEISSDETAKWCDQLYSTLPPLEYIPPADRLKLLPGTIEAMRDGKKYRIVMLGDSIINDTFNSNFQSLLKREYHNSNLEFICSVRGSTGCWHYQESEHFKQYVTDLKPDLLIIGGISQNKDINAIRKTIEMAKKQLDCEILLLSGPLGDDWRKYDEKNLTRGLLKQKWQGSSFALEKEQLASDMRIEFIDMAKIWHNYLGKSQKPWQWFQRDRVHGDDRGKQIVGRILEKYFSL